MTSEPETQNHRPFLLLLWLACFVAALAFYTLWNEPLRRAALNFLPPAMAILFLASFAGYGSLLARRLIGQQDRLLQVIFSAAAGTGMTALFIFVTGILALFSRTLFLAWTAAGLLLFVLAVFHWRRMPPAGSSPASEWNTLAYGILFLFIGVALPYVVAPEVTDDALEYHLLIPKIYLSMGRIGHIPLLLESNYPGLAEYVYLPILSLAGEMPCKGFHFLMALCVLGVIGKIVQKVNPESSTLLAPALFISMPLAVALTAWSWNDFFLTLFILLCIYFLLCYHLTPEGERRGSDLLAAGLMGGLGAWTKYTFVIFFIALLFLSIIGMRKWGWKPRNLMLLYIPIGCFISIWAVKNMLLTGNPVYPFLNQIFHSSSMTKEAFEHFHGTLTRWEFPDWSWKNYFLFPFLITLKPNIIDVHTGVLPLVFLPLILLKSRLEGIRFLKATILFYMLVWAVLQTIVRSLLPVLALMFCVAAAMLPQLRWPGKSYRFAFRCLAIVAIGSNLIIAMVTMYHLFDPVKFFIGLESRSQYRTRLSRSQSVYDHLNSAPDVRKVLLIGLHNPFYLNTANVFSSCCDPPIAEVLTAGTSAPQDIAQKLKALGVSHVVIDFQQYEREQKARLYSWSPEERKRFEAFVTGFCDRTGAYGDDVLFRLR